jgi:hypothetical protein
LNAPAPTATVEGLPTIIIGLRPPRLIDALCFKPF